MMAALKALKKEAGKRCSAPGLEGAKADRPATRLTARLASWLAASANVSPAMLKARVEACALFSRGYAL